MNIISILPPSFVSILVTIAVIIFLAIGLYYLFNDLFKVPNKIIKKNTGRLVRANAKNTDAIQNILDVSSAKLAKFIKLDNEKRERMIKQFDIIEYRVTPEEYYAGAVIRCLIPVLLGLLVLLISTYLGVICILAGVVFLFLSINNVKRTLERRKKSVEEELPKFVSVIEQTIKYNRDVVSIIENYIKDDDTPLCKELTIVLADLKSGDYERALIRFIDRIDSIYVADTMRGLVAVLRGDNMQAYFEKLNEKMRQEEIIRIEKLALAKPRKTKYLTGVLLGCMLLMYIIVFGTVIFESLSGIFGSLSI